jgi:hypothetical protein
MSIQMRAEIIAYSQGQIKGELHSRFLEEPYVFSDLVNMIHKMEEIFDTNGFPQSFLSPRTFKGGKRTAAKRKEERNDAMNSTPEQEIDGFKCTFEISVRFRQNATWQGQILWAEKNMKQNFRSVLEMLKLMDEALTDGDAKSKKAREWAAEG